MNKKTLIASGIIAILSTPLLIAQNVRDLLIFGSDSISDGQKIDVTQSSPQGTNNWTGNKTKINVEFKNQSSNLNVSGPVTLNSNAWNDSGNVAKALLETSGKSSKTDFSGITKGLYSYGSGSGSGPQIRFSGFTSGQEYEVSFWIQTGAQPGQPDVQITDVSSGLSVATYYGLLSAGELSTGSGKSITLSGQNSSYFVKYSFTAGSSSQLALSFNASQAGQSRIPTFDIGLISISAVPEPSAFGLLAGAASLSLAATCRRRRK